MPAAVALGECPYIAVPFAYVTRKPATARSTGCVRQGETHARGARCGGGVAGSARLPARHWPWHHPPPPPPRRCTSSTSAVPNAAVPAVLEAQYAAGRSERRARSGSIVLKPAAGARLAGAHCLPHHARDDRRARGACRRAHAAADQRLGQQAGRSGARSRRLHAAERGDHRVVGTGGRARSLRPRGSLRLRRQDPAAGSRRHGRLTRRALRVRIEVERGERAAPHAAGVEPDDAAGAARVRAPTSARR